MFCLQTSEYAAEINTNNSKDGLTLRVLAVNTQGVLAETRSHITTHGRKNKLLMLLPHKLY